MRRLFFYLTVAWAMAFCVLRAQFPILPGVLDPAGTASCGTPPTTNLKGWYSADCMTAISPCATSYANAHNFVLGDTWKDRSAAANDMIWDYLPGFNPSCIYHTNVISGLPAISMGGADSSGACPFKATSAWDTGDTSTAFFVVFQGTNTTGYRGTFIGPNTTNNFSSIWYLNTETGHALEQYNLWIGVGGNAAADTNWHQLSMQNSNLSDQNSLVFRIDKTSDGPSSFTQQNLVAGLLQEIGTARWNAAYTAALQGRMAEILVYAGTGAILTGGNVTSIETYLGCRYPGLPHA